MKYDVVIAHRVCPALSVTAVGFSAKLDMVRVAADSLFEALDGVRAKGHVILDGCPAEYEDIFLNRNVEVVVERCNAIGNQATFQRQVDILSGVGDAEFVYFSEDDYVYCAEAFREMMACMRKDGVDFVTPLDHPDRYSHLMHEPEVARVMVSGGRHWRTVGTTCLTFMTRPDTVRATRRILETYRKGNLDCTMWLGLTKESVFDFPRQLKFLVQFVVFKSVPFSRLIPLAAWKWHGIRLLWRRKYGLWSPLPTLAEHLSSASMPLVSFGRFAACSRDNLA